MRILILLLLFPALCFGQGRYLNDLTDSVEVSGTVTVGTGTSATHLGKAEDAVHTSGDTGVMSLGVRRDTATALAGTDGDYAPYITDSSGRMHVNVGTSVLPTGAATSGNQSTIIGHVDGVEGLLTTIDADTSALAGTVSSSKVNVNVSSVVKPSYSKVTADYASAQTNTQLVAAQGAGNMICIEKLLISNGATAGTIKIVENTGTPVDIVENIYVGINGGAVINLDGTLCTSANVNLGITSATVTTHSVTVTYSVES